MSILKKIFFLSLFLFVISGMLWGVYELSFSNNKQETALKEENPEVSPKEDSSLDDSHKIAVEKKLEIVSKETVLSPALSASGNSLAYFKKNNGQIIESDFTGDNERVLSARSIPGLEDVLWSADKNKAVLKLKNPDGKISFLYHDFLSDTDKKIKDNVDEISWQTNANRIFYKYFDSKTKVRTLNISDPDGSNWKNLAEVSYRNISIAQIAKTGTVSFWNTGDANEATLLQVVPMSGGEVKTIFKDVFGADYLWNSFGERALVSASDRKGGDKIQLGIINSNGGEYKNLDIPTFVSKCVWSQDGRTVYYALPGGIPQNSVLPNDYNSGKFQTTDTFWKVDIETGEKTRVIETKDISTRVDAGDMFLDSGENLLFFVNKVDGKLYKIVL